MNADFLDDAAFVRSLTARQRAYFHQREQAHCQRLQDALRELSRGVSTVAELYGEASALRLAGGQP